jgi:tetratricopeptide (TPR) repeat protein
MDRHVAGACMWLLVVFMTGGCGDRSAPKAVAPSDGPRMVSNLFKAVRTGDFPPEIDAYLSASRAKVARDDPDWPTLTYLLGEAHLRRGETGQARADFRELASWAASDYPHGPYGDTWGGSALAAVGLWRWLQLLEAGGPASPDEIDRVIAVASALDETRLFSGMVRGGGLLPALPLLEEDIARRLAHIAWSSGRAEAPELFVNFLKIESSGRLAGTDLKIQGEILRQGLFTRERLELFRARRLIDLVRTKAEKERAARTLLRLWGDREMAPEVRAEAGYEWANFKRAQPNRQQLLMVLTDVLKLAGDGPIAEHALYRRGTVHNRGRHDGVVEAFKADMLELLRRFSNGSLADDALYQLATEYLFVPSVDTALGYFGELRQFSGPNDFQDSAYFLPALALFARGGEGDLDSADRLLEEYVNRNPEGPFRLRSLFWRGRIAERKGEAERAQAFFQQVVDSAPYDYYGLRARMHLEDGAGAVGKDLPGEDSRTRAEVREAFANSRAETRLDATSAYHYRLSGAVSSGLYAELVAAERGLGERLDHIPVDRLSERFLVPAVALLLSLRQDALAARDSKLTADNWLTLAGLLGHEAGDWPTAIEMTFVRGDAPQARITNLQRDPRYLATVYPDPVKLEFLKPLYDAAWPIDGSRELSQSLMYAMVRHESRFYPQAISREGALGLFQLMPDLFHSLDRRWGLLAESNLPSYVDYLLEPELNIWLWARWVNAEFPLRSRKGLAMAMMKHQAGSVNVRHWDGYWEAFGADDDVEFRIETARFNETRNFVRRALRDTTIVDAAGFFARD